MGERDQREGGRDGLFLTILNFENRAGLAHRSFKVSDLLKTLVFVAA